jgi:hypothetical protein
MRESLQGFLQYQGMDEIGQRFVNGLTKVGC